MAGERPCSQGRAALGEQPTCVAISLPHAGQAKPGEDTSDTRLLLLWRARGWGNDGKQAVTVGFRERQRETESVPQKEAQTDRTPEHGRSTQNTILANQI